MKKLWQKFCCLLGYHKFEVPPEPLSRPWHRCKVCGHSKAWWMLVAVLPLLALCGCQSPPLPRPMRVSVDLPPEPPDPVARAFAVPAQPEWIVPNVHPGIGPGKMIVENGVGYVSFDTNLLCFRTDQPATQRVLVLANWVYGNHDNAGGFAISGNVLLLSARDPSFGPHHVQEYTLTDWQDGLPTRAVFVTQKDHAGYKASSSRVARMANGIAVIASQGFVYSTLYRNAAGVYSTNFHSLLPWPSPGSVFEMAVRADDAGRLWLYETHDASEGTTTLTRFVERDGRLELHDFNAKLFSKEDALAVDNEFAYLQITDDARCISYQAAKDSISACQPDWWRFCHVNIVELEMFQPVGGHIFPRSVRNDGGQNLWWTQTWKANETYVSQASTNLTTWTDLQVLDVASAAPTSRAEFHAVNPFFVGGQSLPAQFYLRSTPLNYRRILRHTTPEFVERSFSYCSLTTLPNNGIGYHLMPFNVPACTQQETEWRMVGSNESSVADYGRFAQGSGWAFIRRVKKNPPQPDEMVWHLKKLA